MKANTMRRRILEKLAGERERHLFLGLCGDSLPIGVCEASLLFWF